MQTTTQLTTNLAEKLQKNTSSGCSESLTKSLESKYSPAAIQAATAKVLNLFAELKEEYGALFDAKEHRYTPAKAREWAVELLESGINGEQYQQGRWQAMKQQKYPVERAYEFIQLCKQGEVNAYPTANDAFTVACQNCGMRGDIKRDWKHEVVCETANRIGWGKLASASEGFFKTFKQVYEQVVSEHKAGKTFVIPQSHQVAYEHTPVQAGSEADKRISEKLAELRRMAV